MIKYLLFTTILVSQSTFAGTTWLTCSNTEASLLRKQTNYPNGYSSSQWLYGGTRFEPIESNSTKSAVESFDETSKTIIETSEEIVVGSDGAQRKKSTTEFVAKVTISFKDKSPLNFPLNTVTSVTENVICRLIVFQ